MVKELASALQEFEAQNQPVCLFAVMKMDDLINKWTILLAAPWITNENNRSVFDSFVTAMEKRVADEDLRSVARIGILSHRGHLIEELMKFKAGIELKDQQVNGNMIYQGYVIASRPEHCSTSEKM